MSGLSDTGLDIPTQSDIQTEIASDIHGNVSSSLNLSSTAALGQYVGSTSNQVAKVWEALLSLHASMDPLQATGAELDRLCRYVGVYRRPATYSTATLTLNLDAGTYAPGALVVSKVGDATIRFSNVNSVTSTGGTVTGVAFQCADAGQIAAPTGTLSVIANPITGFNSATNPADAIEGTNVEKDAPLRIRRSQQVARAGSGTVDSLKADVLEAVTYVRVYENDGDSPDTGGLPGHSFECLVLGGDDTVIANTIFDNKPAGIQAYGTTTVVVTDGQGNGHSIGFSRPTNVNIYLNIAFNYRAGQYMGDAALQLYLSEWGAANQGPGNDVIHAQLVRVLMDLPGAVDTTVAIDSSPSPTSQSNYVIGSRQIAVFDTSRITITATPVLGVP